MKHNRTPIALAVAGIAFAYAGAAQAQPPSGFTSKVTASPANPKLGQNVTFTIVTTSTVQPAGVVDLEIKDASNKGAGRKAWENETFVKGKPRTYKWTWKPTAKGLYNVKFGVFAPGWKKLNYWNDRALRVTVK